MFPGLSPRGRGNPYGVAPTRIGVRSIPAWAGEPASMVTASGALTVYPRVGGGTRKTGYRVTSGSGLSPRGRGNRVRGRFDHRQGRSIPAWAGEPYVGATVPCVGAVYPRVGGGTVNSYLSDLSNYGLSPRGRGNHGYLPGRYPYQRSIPAWAGEPLPRRPVLARLQVYPRVGGGTS